MILSAYLSPKERLEDSDERFSGGPSSAYNKLLGLELFAMSLKRKWGRSVVLLDSLVPACNSQCDNSEIKISAR